MGCVSSCFRIQDFEDYTNPTSSVNRNYPCPRCLVNNFLNLVMNVLFPLLLLVIYKVELSSKLRNLISFLQYISLFRRGETRSLPSSLQATTVSITSSTSYDNFMSNTFNSTPRPLPYDADPIYFRSRRDSLVSRRDKGSSHSHEEAEPLRSDPDLDSESFSVEGSKWVNKLIISGEDSKEDFSKSSRRILKSKTMAAGNENMYLLSDDEDVCPTCLEGIHFHLLPLFFDQCIWRKLSIILFGFSAEYTSENPKIVTKCSHHFHLSCIYEWMERSENCPVCGKVTLFIFFWPISRCLQQITPFSLAQMNGKMSNNLWKTRVELS